LRFASLEGKKEKAGRHIIGWQVDDFVPFRVDDLAKCGMTTGFMRLMIGVDDLMQIVLTLDFYEKCTLVHLTAEPSDGPNFSKP